VNNTKDFKLDYLLESGSQRIECRKGMTGWYSVVLVLC